MILLPNGEPGERWEIPTVNSGPIVMVPQKQLPAP